MYNILLGVSCLLAAALAIILWPVTLAFLAFHGMDYFILAGERASSRAAHRRARAAYIAAHTMGKK